MYRMEMLLIGKCILVDEKEKRMRTKRWPQRPFVHESFHPFIRVRIPKWYLSHKLKGDCVSYISLGISHYHLIEKGPRFLYTFGL